MCIFMSKQEPDSLGGTEEHQKRGKRTYWWGWGTRELSHNINIEN